MKRSTVPFNRAKKIEREKDRPFTLPPGKFRPKQSLGQNYLSDQNYVMKIINKFSDQSENGTNVVEIGPGTGALTKELIKRYPNMTAIEIDQRAVSFLKSKLPSLNVLHQDVLKFDWKKFSLCKGNKVNIIANLPYNIVSQVLFSFADSYEAIGNAVVTMQLELADRLIAKPRTKQYGIPSVVFQLYASTEKLFHIPPSVFYPVPDVDSALIKIDFSKKNNALDSVDISLFRRVLLLSFQQRRKMLRQSLKELINRDELVLPEKWSTKRPEELSPLEFIELTIDLYGTKVHPSMDPFQLEEINRAFWRAPLYGSNLKH